MANRWYTQFFGTLHKKPVMMDCNFIIDPDNANGLGISSLKGAGIANVFMNTTASFAGDTHTNTVIDGIASTADLKVGMVLSGAGIVAGTVITAITSATAITVNPATTATASGVTISYRGVSANGALNPNPLAGYILVQFQDNFNFYYFGTSQFEAPQTGTDILLTAGTMVIGTPYVISVVGTTTAAQWQAVGLPIGLTPAIGESFFATATTGVGTGAVQASSSTGVVGIEIVGDPNQTLGANYVGASKLGGSSGAYMILKSLDSLGAIASPESGTTVYLSFFMSNSFITVNGS